MVSFLSYFLHRLVEVLFHICVATYHKFFLLLLSFCSWVKPQQCSAFYKFLFVSDQIRVDPNSTNDHLITQLATLDGTTRIQTTICSYCIWISDIYSSLCLQRKLLGCFSSLARTAFPFYCFLNCQMFFWNGKGFICSFSISILAQICLTIFHNPRYYYDFHKYLVCHSKASYTSMS